MTRTILITGATGFIGSRVLAAALSRPGLRVVALARNTGALPRAAGGSTVLRADLADPASLRGSCTGVHTLVHCASYVGSSPQAAAAVNDRGTQALLEEATRAGVRRIVYVSTAAVHGPGPFRCARSADTPLAPGSAASRTRAAAEWHVRAAGGTVLRPHLVYGAGDRWVVPALATLIGRLGGRVPRTDARLSLVDVHALATGALAAALSPDTPAGVYAAAHPLPVPGRAVVEAAVSVLEPAESREMVSQAEARQELAGDPAALKYLSMLSTDHYFADDGLWALPGAEQGPDFAAGFAAHAGWYREFLRAAAERALRPVRPA